MKHLLILLLLSGLSPFQSQEVYICRSGTSYAYHHKLCRGLSNCTHRIDTVTVKEAIASGHTKPCGNCYRK